MQPRRNEMLAWWPNMELQAILLQIFIMITLPTLNFTNSWRYCDLSIITSHVSPRLHLPKGFPGNSLEYVLFKHTYAIHEVLHFYYTT